MSSHRRSTKYFSRKPNARKALIRGLMISLVEHERIATTVVKAKELKRHIERAITVGKKDDALTGRRLLQSTISNETAVGKIMTDIAPRFKARAGGYTRIIKIGRRPGDTAEMAFIEFVDYDFEKRGPGTVDAAAAPEKKAAKGKKKDTTAVVAASKEKAKIAKATSKSAAAKKKSVQQMQKKSRAANRA